MSINTSATQTRPDPVVMTEAEWLAEGERRFGGNRRDWRFLCPSCGRETAAQEWLDAGAQVGEVAFSCIGRHLPGTAEAFQRKKHGRGCTYAGGGLFRLNPVKVMFEDGGSVDFFEFAPASETSGEVAA